MTSVESHYVPYTGPATMLLIKSIPSGQAQCVRLGGLAGMKAGVVAG